MLNRIVAMLLTFFLLDFSHAQSRMEGVTITLSGPDTSGQHLDPLYFKKGEQLVVLPQSIQYRSAIRGIRDQLVRNGWQQSTDRYGPRVLCNIRPLLPHPGTNELTVSAECSGRNIRYTYQIFGATGVNTDGNQLDLQETPSVSQMIDRLTGSVTAIERSLQGSR